MKYDVRQIIIIIIFTHVQKDFQIHSNFNFDKCLKSFLDKISNFQENNSNFTYSLKS